MSINLFKILPAKILIFVFFTAGYAQNYDTLKLAPGFRSIDAENYISVLVADSAVDVNTVLQQYLNSKNGVQEELKSTVGFSAKNYWVFFHIQNNTGQDTELYLVVNNPHIDFIELYTFNDSTAHKLYAAGDRVVFAERPVKNRLYLFPVNIKNNEHKNFILKIDKRNAAVSFPLSVWTQEERISYDNKFNLIYGAYFGIVFLIFLYSIIGFFYLKRTTFLYYAMYVLSIGLYIYTVLGFSFEYLYPFSKDLNNHARVVLIIFILAFLILFSQKLLNTKQYALVYHKILNFINIFIALMLIKWVFFSKLYTPFTVLFLKVFYLVLFVFVTVIILSLIKVYKHQKKIVLFYIAAFTAFFTGGFLMVLIEWGVINESFFVINPVFVGSVVEMIIFAFALSFQIKQIFETNIELSVKVAESQKQSMRSYLQGVEKERVRIAKELHDSVGSKINMLRSNAQIKENENKKLASQIDELGNLIRNISHEIYLPEMKMIGLKAKLENLKNKFSATSGVATEIDFYDFPDELPENIEKEIFHIIEEALNNVLKYAEATEVAIQLFGHEKELAINVEDNGKGFDMNKKNYMEGIGLKIMKSRAENLGGRFEISSFPGNGTSIMVVIPRKN